MVILHYSGNKEIQTHAPSSSQILLPMLHIFPIVEQEKKIRSHKEKETNTSIQGSQKVTCLCLRKFRFG